MFKAILLLIIPLFFSFSGVTAEMILSPEFIEQLRASGKKERAELNKYGWSVSVGAKDEFTDKATIFIRPENVAGAEQISVSASKIAASAVEMDRLIARYTISHGDK